VKLWIQCYYLLTEQVEYDVKEEKMANKDKGKEKDKKKKKKKDKKQE